MFIAFVQRVLRPSKSRLPGAAWIQAVESTVEQEVVHKVHDHLMGPMDPMDPRYGSVERTKVDLVRPSRAKQGELCIFRSVGDVDF